MISYIFQSRVKNIFTALTATVVCLFFLFHPLFFFIDFLDKYFLSDLFFLPAALAALIYLITLKRYYRIKKLLFPLGFILSAVLCIIKFFFSTVGILDDLLYLLTRRSPVIFFSLGEVCCCLIITAANILCVIGSVSNFKRVFLFKAGTLVCIISLPVLLLLSIGQVVSDPFGFLGGLDVLNSYSLSPILLGTLFYLSLFLFTLNPKTEDIDLALYSEARRQKKPQKTQDVPETESESVPEDCWSCMGCGKLVSLESRECSCGYKRI